MKHIKDLYDARFDLKQLTEILNIFRFSISSFVEIGSRDGHDTHFVTNYWGIPSDKCLIIEAHPNFHENIIEIYPQYECVNVAASNVDGVIDFNAAIIGQEQNVGISSVLDRKLGSIISNRIEIEAARMDSIMGRFKIESFDLCKIDVEGFGLQVLQGFGDKIKDFKAIQIELETKEVWEGQSYYKDVVEYLSEYNFEILCQIVLNDLQTDVLFYKIN